MSEAGGEITISQARQEGRSQLAKEPHYISSRLLEALGGVKETTVAGELVSKGAYLWGVEDREKGGGILRHSLLTSRTAYNLAKDLKKAQVKEYEDINLQWVVEAAVLHDVTKLYGEDREKLPPNLKQALGLKENFREISTEVDNVGIAWLKELGFPSEGNINAVAQEVFSNLGLTDQEFIEKHNLNSETSLTRWERFLTKTREKGKEERATHLVGLLIKEKKTPPS